MPLHASTVQTLLSLGQAVPLGLNALVGQVSAVPLQVSETSHVSAAARQTVFDCAVMGITVQVPLWHFPTPQALPPLPHCASLVHWTQLPPTQVLPPLTAQEAPSGLLPSAGQGAAFPGQLSARSQEFAAAGRQIWDAGWKALVGQSALPPGQFSARSQMPAETRHSYDAGRKVSVGQMALAPLQASARSQPPGASGRQTVPALPAGC